MILVSLQFDARMAAVYRDRRGSWLGAGPAGADADIASLGGTLLGTVPACVHVGHARTVVGGLLPAGASRAVAEDQHAVTGNGAWIALVDSLGWGSEPAVRYETDAGAIVRPVLPARWTREPVPDADEPCPACGAGTWERVTPNDTSRGSGFSDGGPVRSTAVIVCARCGHEVREGTWYSPGASRAPSSPLRALRHRWRLLSLRPDRRAPAIDELGFPVYARTGADAELNGYGSGPEGVHSVTMRQDRIEITTAGLRHACIEAEDESVVALRSVIHAAEPMDSGAGSNAARALRIDARRRAVAARAARAEPSAVELPVDGAPVRFTGLRDPAGWAAVGETTEVRIVIAAGRIGPEAVTLRKL